MLCRDLTTVAGIVLGALMIVTWCVVVIRRQGVGVGTGVHAALAIAVVLVVFTHYREISIKNVLELKAELVKQKAETQQLLAENRQLRSSAERIPELAAQVKKLEEDIVRNRASEQALQRRVVELQTALHSSEKQRLSILAENSQLRSSAEQVPKLTAQVHQLQEQIEWSKLTEQLLARKLASLQKENASLVAAYSKCRQGD